MLSSWMSTRRAMTVELTMFAAYSVVAALVILADGLLVRWAVGVCVIGLLGLHWATTSYAYGDGWTDAKRDTMVAERESAAQAQRDRGEIQ